MDQKLHQLKGKVILAGAGPGDVDLITVKLQKQLAIADVIITDRLVNPQILETYARRDALWIGAGKQGYNDASITQDEINQLILENADQGKLVLRLKGGDTSIFSNIFDELETLVNHDIEFEIIPGITAAAGASAYAGIPLTARGFSQGVQFLTFNPNSVYSPDRWKELANAKETLVFYMAAKNVIGLSELLMRYTRKPATPLALIEQATTEHQRVQLTTLEKCRFEFAGMRFSSPSLVIIGDVVNLHEKFKWFQNTEEAGSVFRDLVNE